MSCWRCGSILVSSNMLCRDTRNPFNGNYFYRPLRSWGKVMFLHVSVILFTREWYPSMPCRFPGSHPGEKLKGPARRGSPGPHRGGGISRPTPGGHLQAHTWDDLQAHTQGVYPNMHWGRPPWRLLLRAVHILLECILVITKFSENI